MTLSLNKHFRKPDNSRKHNSCSSHCCLEHTAYQTALKLVTRYLYTLNMKWPETCSNPMTFNASANTSWYQTPRARSQTHHWPNTYLLHIKLIKCLLFCFSLPIIYYLQLARCYSHAREGCQVGALKEHVCQLGGKSTFTVIGRSCSNGCQISCLTTRCLVLPSTCPFESVGGACLGANPLKWVDQLWAELVSRDSRCWCACSPN